MLELGHTGVPGGSFFLLFSFLCSLYLYDGGRFVLRGTQVLFGFVISGTVRLGIIMVSLLRYRQIMVQ